MSRGSRAEKQWLGRLSLAVFFSSVLVGQSPGQGLASAPGTAGVRHSATAHSTGKPSISPGRDALVDRSIDRRVDADVLEQSKGPSGLESLPANGPLRLRQPGGAPGADSGSWVAQPTADEAPVTPSPVSYPTAPSFPLPFAPIGPRPAIGEEPGARYPEAWLQARRRARARRRDWGESRRRQSRQSARNSQPRHDHVDLRNPRRTDQRLQSFSHSGGRRAHPPRKNASLTIP